MVGATWTPERLRDTGWIEYRDGGFGDHAGPFWHRLVDDRLTCGFFAEERHRNRGGFVHGGMLATLADRVLGHTGRLADPARRQATIDLTIHFISAAPIGAFVTGTATLLRQTTTLAFLSGQLTVEDQLVANLSGIWRIRPGTTIAAPAEQ